MFFSLFLSFTEKGISNGVQTRQSDQRPFDETVCDASITNGDVIKPSKKMQNVCDGGDIKHGELCVQ